MVYILVKSQVEDFGKWKEAFDAHDEMRVTGGQSGAPQVFHSADDPNSTVVLLEWKDKESAETFANSDDLKKAMMDGGVSGAPDMMYLDAA